MSASALLFVFFQTYLIPFLFAIGLFYFVYACIEYFIIGQGGDEGRAQHGRVLFLKSIAWFFLALLIHLVTLLVVWIASLSIMSSGNNSYPSGGGGFNRQDAVLEVPNVPSR